MPSLLNFSNVFLLSSIHTNSVGKVRNLLIFVNIIGCLDIALILHLYCNLAAILRLQMGLCTAADIPLGCISISCPSLHGTVLHCTVLHCTVLHCTVLYCTVLFHYNAHWIKLQFLCSVNALLYTTMYSLRNSPIYDEFIYPES